MGGLSAIGFVSPWLLWAALALPVIWLLLRVVPPAPIRQRFPGVVLLLGLDDRDSTSRRTPPWLLFLRVLALGLAIVGFAGPVLNPKPMGPGHGPLLLLADASWADAGAWAEKRARLVAANDEAVRAGRPLAFADLGLPQPGPVVFSTDPALRDRLAALQPHPWEPADMAAFGKTLPVGEFETLWLSDGLARAGRDALFADLARHGPVTVVEAARRVLALRPASLSDGKIATMVLRAGGAGTVTAEVVAHGLDPNGIERELARQSVTLAPDALTGPVAFNLAPELRNRLTRLEIAGASSAGAVALAGDALKRRKVALIETGAPREGLALLAPGHYLREALGPTTDLIEGALPDLLPAAPDVVVLADAGRLPPAEATALADWVRAGGLLVRFAGPHLAATVGDGATDDGLLPVALRPGGLSTGGAMSWGAPRTLAAFPDGSPFHGLAVPAEVTVKTQVLAEPGPDLAARTIAALDDGTPLVTRAPLGKGQVVLFHVTANAEWSNLPLSGLFVQMLDRLAISSTPAATGAQGLDGVDWVPDRVLDAYGALAPADGLAGGLAGVPGARLAKGVPAADMPPGLYRAEARQVALNVIAPDRSLATAAWPASARLESLAQPAPRLLKGWALAAALALILADSLATALMGGHIPPRPTARRAARSATRPRGTAAVLVLLAAVAAAPARVRAADAAADPAADQRLIDAAGGMVLAHVLTGDVDTDDLAEAGLAGLSQVLTARTSVEPGAPVGVDLNRDELSVYAFLYWPVTLDQPAPSPDAYRRLNRFLQTGGMILFDTRDADLGADGATTPEAARLRQLAAPLDIPPLEPMPKDHVLTRSFYLLQDFPGRYTQGQIWVEAAPPDAEKAAGMPFRNANDSVTPVVIGGNDWAAAWAIDAAGQPLLPVGRGAAGDRQRELAYRFGVNLIMHVLTGNYKSDQVHVPALLERLGQ